MKPHITDILRDIKSRDAIHSANALRECDRIASLIPALESGDGIANDFIPIRLATCFEVAVRSNVFRLIEFGQPYLARSKEVVKDVKFDFLLSMAISEREITIADIVSNSISCSNLDPVVSAFEKLVGPEFCHRLAHIQDRWAEVALGEHSGPLIGNINTVFESIRKLLNLRHVLVHELPDKKPYDVCDLEGFVASVRAFVAALDELTARELHGDYPVTQHDMNLGAIKKFEQVSAELDKLLLEIQKRGIVSFDFLKASQDTWVAYRAAEAEWWGSPFQGGSMKPLLYYNAARRLTETRISDLHDWLNNYAPLVA